MTAGRAADALVAHPLMERVTQSKLRLRVRSPFFATLALFADVAFDETIGGGGSATDGQRVLLRPSFVRSASADALDFAVLHALLHAALHHPARQRSRDKETWNVAADIVVNGIIGGLGLALPPDAVRDDALAAWRVEDIYDLLLKERAIRPPPKAPADLFETEGALFATPRGEKDRENFWHAALREAEAAQARAGGDVPLAMTRLLRAGGASRLDWRAQLWRFLVRTPTDFEGFDRRFLWQGVYLDALAGSSLRVLVCVDTSASIQAADLAAFMTEIAEMARTYPHLELELFFADRALHGPFAFHADAPLPAAIGGGGTSFAPFFAHAAREEDLTKGIVLVYLTDGRGDFPREASRLPTLWVVTARGAADATFPFGEVIRLGEVRT
ncbi:MAG: hydrolase [Myxococcales bacterium]|nr:hydrolase [Myxococcales bacterium]